MKRMTTIGAALAAALLGAAAHAQPGPPPDGPRPLALHRISPEQAEAAWELQAQSVARSLGLAGETTEQLITAYVAARGDFQEAMKDARPARGAGRGRGGAGPGGGWNPPAGDDDQPARGARRAPGARRGAFEEIRTAERVKLETALAAFLRTEQVKVAVATLGTFDHRWDVMTNAIAEIGLSEEATFAAMEPIRTFVATTAEAREAARKSAVRDRDATREAMQAAHDRLDHALSAILTPDQMGTFRAAMRPPVRDGAPGPRLAQLDANGDGLIQRDEVPPRLIPFFEKADTNGDGALDRDEIAAARRQRDAGPAPGFGPGPGPAPGPMWDDDPPPPPPDLDPPDEI